MSELLGTSIWITLAITIVFAGGASWMMGQALAANWRPLWQLFPYALLLGLADRFVIYALFDGELGSLTGYIIDTCILTAIALIAFRVTRVHKMVTQYPWLFGQASPFVLRNKREGEDD